MVETCINVIPGDDVLHLGHVMPSVWAEMYEMYTDLCT